MTLAFSMDPSVKFLKLANGSASAPSLSFASEPNTGFFWNNAGDVRLVLSGSLAVQFTGTTINIASDTATFKGGTQGDVNMQRIANAFGAMYKFQTTTTVGAPAANICVGMVLFNCAHLLTTCTTLTVLNGANTGTLTNSPTVGNPQTWARVNNNGCEYAVPLWRV